MKVLIVCKVSGRLLAAVHLHNSAANRPRSKPKSVDANDLGVDDPKQVTLHAYPVIHK